MYLLLVTEDVCCEYWIAEEELIFGTEIIEGVRELYFKELRLGLFWELKDYDFSSS